jgi:glycosyltransferase involved in cell wall biosynthesis
MIAVSVVIPVFNAGKHVEKSMESLVHQTLPNCEFIFVNDGSTDDSRAIIEKYQENDDRIRLYNQENQGVSAARNRGIELAQGEFIGFVDADDFIQSTMYEVLYALAKKEHVSIVTSQFYKESNGTTTTTKSKFPVDVALDKNYINQHVLPQFIQDSSLNSACTKLYESKLIKNIKFPVGVPLGEDGIFNLHAFDAAQSVLFTNFCGYHYVEVEGSATRNASGKDYFKRALEVFAFDYQPLVSVELNSEQVTEWKSLRLLENVMSYIHIYLQPDPSTDFLDRVTYVKQMIHHELVQKAIQKYYPQICLGKSKYQRFVLKCIKNKSLIQLIGVNLYFQIRNK